MLWEHLRGTFQLEFLRWEDWAGLCRRRIKLCISVDIRRLLESSACLEVEDESEGSIAIEIVSMQLFAS